MLKTLPLAVVIALGITAPAAASPDNQLNEWEGFAKETAIPVAAADRPADWDDLYRHRRTVNPPLREWNNFAEETPTPAAGTGHIEDWTGTYPRAGNPPLREWTNFAEETATPN